MWFNELDWAASRTRDGGTDMKTAVRGLATGPRLGTEASDANS